MINQHQFIWAWWYTERTSLESCNKRGKSFKNTCNRSHRKPHLIKINCLTVPVPMLSTLAMSKGLLSLNKRKACFNVCSSRQRPTCSTNSNVNAEPLVTEYIHLSCLWCCKVWLMIFNWSVQCRHMRECIGRWENWTNSDCIISTCDSQSS
jgi:hypothetical protein